jgi:predicted kinase
VTLPLVVIVAGPPCTGKTTLARRLARDLGLPYVGKDDIKERLFDSLGWNDRAWSKKLGVASMDLLYYMIESQVAAGRSLVAESNFKAEFDSRRFQDIARRCPFEAVQIQCRTEGALLLDRFRARDRSGERHPGHVGSDRDDEVAAVLLRGRHDPLDLPGEILEVDTTDFARVQYGDIRAAVASHLRGRG